LGYSTHISLTTPIAPALINYYDQGFLKAPTEPLLDPGGGFTSETAARGLQKRNGRYLKLN
jgi:hypothetical protein